MNRRGFCKGVLLAAAGIGGFTSAAAAGPSEKFVCTVVVDMASGETLLREGPADRRFSPCSSFKFPLAVMGFDAGILTDPHHPLWQYRPEFQASMEAAKKATDPTIWLRDSIVWYSQEITRRLGAARFQNYVTAFDYGNEDLTGNPGRGDGLTQAWLMSSLEISADEQVAFIKRFLRRELPVSAHAYEATEASIATYPAQGGWSVHGKSGSGWMRDAAGRPDRSRPQGWFVGWADKGDRRIAFARFQRDDRASETPGGSVARAAILKDLPQLAGT